MQPPLESAVGPASELEPVHLLGSKNGSDGQGFQLDSLLDALQAVRAGDFSVRLPANQTGIEGKIADAFNDIVAANQRIEQQLDEVGEAVGRQGKTRMRVRFGLAGGSPLGQFASATVRLPGGTGPFDAIRFTIRAEKPMRISVQVRDTTADRWQPTASLGKPTLLLHVVSDRADQAGRARRRAPGSAPDRPRRCRSTASCPSARGCG